MRIAARLGVQMEFCTAAVGKSRAARGNAIDVGGLVDPAAVSANRVRRMVRARGENRSRFERWDCKIPALSVRLRISSFLLRTERNLNLSVRPYVADVIVVNDRDHVTAAGGKRVGHQEVDEPDAGVHRQTRKGN